MTTTPTEKIRAALEFYAGKLTEFEEAKQALSAMEGMVLVRDWQPIETAPRGDDYPYSKVSDNPATYVLLWNGHHVGVGFIMLDEDGIEYRSYDENTEIIEPSPIKWMPLIAPYVKGGE